MPNGALLARSSSRKMRTGRVLFRHCAVAQCRHSLVRTSHSASCTPQSHAGGCVHVCFTNGPLSSVRVPYKPPLACLVIPLGITIIGTYTGAYCDFALPASFVVRVVRKRPVCSYREYVELGAICFTISLYRYMRNWRLSFSDPKWSV